MPDHVAVITWIFESLESDPAEAADVLPRIDAVGHRVVHGGEQYRQAVTIQAQVLADLNRLSALAPLHNPACVAGIRAAQACLGHTVPMVAVFDTAFHHTLPAYAPAIRARICAGMEWCGVRLDAERNVAAVGLAAGCVARVSQDDATVAAYVVAVDEETWIAQETVRCLRQMEDG